MVKLKVERPNEVVERSNIVKTIWFIKKFVCFGVFQSETSMGNEEPTLEAFVIFLIIQHLLISLIVLLIARFIHGFTLSVIGALTGFIKRLYNTVTVHIVSSVLISIFYKVNLKYSLFVQQSPLLLFPFFILIDFLKIVETEFIFSIFMIVSVRKIVNSLGYCECEDSYIKRYSYKLILILAQIGVFLILKSSVFINL